MKQDIIDIFMENPNACIKTVADSYGLSSSKVAYWVRDIRNKRYAGMNPNNIVPDNYKGKVRRCLKCKQSFCVTENYYRCHSCRSNFK